MSKGKSNRKHGRNKAKCLRYTQQHRREKNKLKRVLKSNGEKFAELWKRKYKVTNA